VNAFKCKFENLMGKEVNIQLLFEEAINPEYAEGNCYRKVRLNR